MFNYKNKYVHSMNIIKKNWFKSIAIYFSFCGKNYAAGESPDQKLENW